MSLAGRPHHKDLLTDRFTLDRLVGSGGMGEVYRGLDLATGRPVAVKLLTGRRGDGDARFTREAQILAGIDHPHVVRYVAHGVTAAGERWLAMEWLDGEDLAQRLSRGPLPADEAAALGLALAEALGSAHALGVIHRDMKPGNVFLAGGRVAEAKLLDFGVAQLSGQTRITRTGTTMGTPGYMAPEQVRGDDAIDARADVFSLGCVLFECLTGEPAFPGSHPMAILAKILLHSPPRLRDARPDLPAELDALLDRMLAKNPEDRPRDGREVAEALRALGPLPRGPASVPPASPRIRELLTGSEQRAIAILLVGAPAGPGDAASADPADAVLRRVALAYGGQVDRLLDGSSVILLLGAALATDLAAQAARCALALRAERSGLPVTLAVGRSEIKGRMPMGSAIDRASRLAGERPRGAGPVIVDEVTAGLLGARFDVRPGAVGFELHGERAGTDGGRTLLGRETPCVGRERELASLKQIFDVCVEDGAAQAVLLTAPAGMGKSRLAQELLRHVEARGERAAVWRGRADPLQVGSPFALLGQAMRRAFGIREGEPLEVRREKLRASVLARLGEGKRHVAEFLGEILAAPFPDEESLPLRTARRDAQLMNERLQAAFLELLAAECAAGPLVLLLEDLQWSDRPTVQLVDRALRDHPSLRFFVLGLARPEAHERFPRLWADRGAQEIHLRRLLPRACERLVQHALGEGVERGVIERLAQLSDGNAFYLEELIRATAEGRGAELPETVVAMVQSRLGGLDDASRRVLRAASTFGESFWLGGVEALLGGAAAAGDAQAILADLVGREILLRRAESRFPGEIEFAFRHSLLREGAYAMLTEKDRRIAHRLAASWLEGRCEPDPLVLAEHCEKGGDAARAGRFYQRAAEAATGRGDSAAAVAHARRGLACVTPGEIRVGLLGALCEASVWDPALANAALPYGEELFRAAEQGSAPWVHGMLVMLASALSEGRLEELMVTLRGLEETRPAPDAAGALVFAICTGIAMIDRVGWVREASAAMERLGAICRGLGGAEPLTWALLHGATARRGAYAAEDPAGALAHGREAIALFEAVGHERSLSVQRVIEGMNLWYLGASAEAERALTGMSLRDEELGYEASLRAFCLAWLLADRGALDEARGWAARLVASGRSRQAPLDEARGRWALGEVLRRAGALDEAEVEIEAALGMLRAAAPIDVPGALATLSALRLAQGRAVQAHTAAGEGMRKSEAMGACSQFCRGAFLRLVHAECLEAVGDRAGARAAIAGAKRRLLGIAERIGGEGEKRRFLEEVPENARTMALAS